MKNAEATNDSASSRIAQTGLDDREREPATPTGDLGRGLADLELGVALDEPCAPRSPANSLVRDVEEHGQRAATKPPVPIRWRMVRLRKK